MVDRSGRTGERFALVTPMARSFPERMCGIADGKLSNIMSIWPPSRSVSAGALPLYGMCVMSVRLNTLKSSAAMCSADPAPAEP